jgi:hypothetical protein
LKVLENLQNVRMVDLTQQINFIVKTGQVFFLEMGFVHNFDCP